MNKQLTAIIEKEGDGYVALCPDVDIASQGDTIEEAKKNLERMRLGQKQLSTLFSQVKQEREERIQSLKLIPWGNKYRNSGNQKIRW